MNREKGTYILEVKNLERSYSTSAPDGKKIVYPVLKGLTFSVRYGEFISIMGSSGCGKTTLLNTLGMLHRPNGGKVFYKGIDTAKIYGDRLAKIRRSELAFVFQDFYLMDSLTVEENIMMPLILSEANPKRSAATARRLARQFGIGSLLEKKPYELSGGERQRTAICRAMAGDPELILADEPTGNLDSNSSIQVIRTLVNINRKFGKTILMVTHDPKMASYSDKIILLKDGEILNTLVKKGDNKSFYGTILRQMVHL